MTGILAALAAVLVAAVVVTILVFPAGAAIACPACYGFERLEGDVFVEKGMMPQMRARLAATLGEARKRVRDFYGSFDGAPRILACASEECFRRIETHRIRGRTFADIAFILSPRGLDPLIVTHEFSHIEVHHRLGLVALARGAIPAWFDEGLAVYVSDDRRYLGPVAAADRCLVRSDEELPSAMREWMRRATGMDDDRLYAKSACRVSRWIAANGGPAAVTKLLARVSTGTSFAQAYGAP